MAMIELLNLAHTYDRTSNAPQFALRPTTMTWDDGGAFALLGPSGCGKTSLLNIISGLITPSHGRVLFDAVDVTAAAPQQRNIAQVFQFPVIYDTMTVYDNLAFPLRNRGWKSLDIRSRVQHIAQMLELEDDLKNSASGLSADVKQKISLGRGLVRPDVAAVLFDEPLTVIDPHLKWLLRRKLKQIHHELKLSLIYVTHDQTEALTFADRVVVMAQGEVVQVGTPQELFERPAHRFVGYFIGSPGMNFIPCAWVDDAAWVAGAIVATQSESAPPEASELCIGIRPEHIQLHGAANQNRVPVRVIDVRDVGTHVMARLDVAGTHIHVKLDQVSVDEARATKDIYLPPHRCALYSGERRVQ